jgi:hypothetical protein
MEMGGEVCHSEIINKKSAILNIMIEGGYGGAGGASAPQIGGLGAKGGRGGDGGSSTGGIGMLF